MSGDQSSEARSSGKPHTHQLMSGGVVGCTRDHREERQDRPAGKVTVVLEKFDPAQPGRTDAWATHKTTLLIRESHLEAIQRKHGMSLIKWLETALEIELEALIWE